MKKIKASDLKQGDVIHAYLWSNLWMRVALTTCTVMSVQDCPGGNLSIMVKAKDGLNEYLTDIFTPAAAEFAAA